MTTTGPTPPSVDETPALSAAAAAVPRRGPLGSAVSADFEALKNDMEQAREMACDYQRALAQESNEHASLKRLFEKAKDDLIRLHQGIAQLREERHQFANDAMRAIALEMKLDRVTKERDCLQCEVDALRKTRASEADERVVQLTREIERLRREAGEPKYDAPSPNRAAPRAERRPEPRDQIAVPFDEIDADDVTIVRTECIPVSAARKMRMR